MKEEFFDYVKEAFKARPFGMPIPPNWLGLVGFLMAGFLSPGFWLIGAGMELAYLLLVAHNPRFRAVINAKRLYESRQREKLAMDEALKRISPERADRFAYLRQRCQQILEDQHMETDSAVHQMQAGGLGRLLGIYLKLLMTQSAMERMLGESDADATTLEHMHASVLAQMEAAEAGSELRRSLEGQAAILEKRRQAVAEGAERLAFTESELSRIEQQVSLIRDQVRLSAAPETVSTQIDRVSGELNETSQWVSEQQRLFGSDAWSDSLDVPLEDFQSSPPLPSESQNQ